MSQTKPSRSDLPSQILTEAVEDLSTATTLEAITDIVAKAARALSGADGTSFVLRTTCVVRLRLLWGLPTL